MKYKVWYPEWDANCEIDALNMRMAAETAMGKFESESADYPVAGGDTRLVIVTDCIGAAKTFNVSGRSEPVYDAVEVVPCP